MTLGNIHLTPQLVQAVRDAVDIVDVASEHTRLRKAGRRLTGLCPLHKEKTPSFSVDPDQGLFYCFGCGRGGDAIKLHMLLSGDDFPAAIEVLAQRYGIPLPRVTRATGGRGRDEHDIEGVLKAAAEYFTEQLGRSATTRRYLEERGIPQSLIERFGLGFAPDGWQNLLESLGRRFSVEDLTAAGLAGRSERSGKPYDRFRNRLMFPIRSAAGRIVGFGGRTLGDDRAKYVNTSETSSFQKGYLLYGLDVAKREIRESGTAVLVEGYFDVLGVLASGIGTAVATMGTAVTPEQARLLGRYADEVIVGYDGDTAGEEAFRRALPILLAQNLTVRRACFGVDHDPDSLRLAEGPEAVEQAIEGAKDAVEMELARVIPEGVRSDPKKQARAAREIGELLRAIPDSVLRYSYGRQAADGLGIPTELLWRRVGQRSDVLEKREEKPDERSTGLVRSLEELVLQLLLSGDTDVPDLEALPPPEAFLIPSCRNIYRVFCDLYRERAPQRPKVQEVLGRIPQAGSEVDQVARLLLEGASARTPEELGDALRRMSRRWLQQQLKGLSSEIAAAQRAGDQALVERLVREKTALSRALHRGQALSDETE